MPQQKTKSSTQQPGGLKSGINKSGIKWFVFLNDDYCRNLGLSIEQVRKYIF